MNNLNFCLDAISSSFEFIKLLQNDNKYTFKPSLKGVTVQGSELKLGFSTFGLKMYYMNGEWDNLDISEKEDWYEYINSFQKTLPNIPKNSFVDDVMYRFYIENNINEKIKDVIKNILNLFPKYSFDDNKTKFLKAINAETKQALSSLHQVGFKSAKNYVPQHKSPEQILNYLDSLDWRKPWTSGAQYASLCVYSTIYLNDNKECLKKFSDYIVDKETGSYFKHKPDHSREIINGAMKMLSGFDWIDYEIHYPEKLIDYCLDNSPIIEGCDVVDFLYVLYRCSKQTNHKKQEILNKMNESIEEIKKLYHQESGGFSYYKNKSQTHYYGLEITSGFNTPDIHGTLLCTWALLMILDLNGELNKSRYKIIKP